MICSTISSGKNSAFDRQQNGGDFVKFRRFRCINLFISDILSHFGHHVQRTENTFLFHDKYHMHLFH